MKKIDKSRIDHHLINILLSVIYTGLSGYLLANALRYTSISQTLFILGFILLILINIFLVIFADWTKTHRVFRSVATFFIVFFIILNSLGIFYVLRIGMAVDKVIVDTNKEQYEELVTSFVTYDNTSLTSVDALSGKNFGLVDNETFQEGHILPIAELERLKINVNFKYYDSYNDLLLGLFNDEVDVASMPEQYYSMFIINDGYEEYLDKTKSIYDFKSKVKIDSVNTVDKDLSKEPFSVLLMGNDGGRTDTLIVATFNPLTMTATMTSIARDSYVPIACYKNQASDKINHSRQISRQCTIDTVSNMLDVDIDYFIEVNFTAVVEVVDALGGLWLESPIEFVGQDSSDERGNFTVWVGKGWQTMDGQQALAFARERKNMPGGDLQRQINQQKVITAMAQKLLETKDVNQLLKVLEAAGSNIKTNFSLNQMTNLANYMVKEMNSNSINNFYLLQIKNSRITGYFSWMYNDNLQLPLSIYRPYKGSIEDAQFIIRQNMMDEYQLSSNTKYTFSISSPYQTPNLIKDVYDEKEVHETLPDFMPSMISKNDTWTLERVKNWQSARNWINLNIVEIWPDNPLYNASYAYNQIISQSVKYGVKTANITNLNVSVIKHVLDCSILENRQDAQCKYIVPNFIGMNLQQVNDWSVNNNYPVSIVKIADTDPNYDRAKINIITGQREQAYTKLNTLNNAELVVYTMDYPNVIFPVEKMTTEIWTKLQLETWFKANMYKDPIFVYEKEYSKTLAKDVFVGASIKEQPVIKDTQVKSNIQITITLSKGPEPVVPTDPTDPAEPGDGTSVTTP